MHTDKGWSDIGYHDVIKRNGVHQAGRPVERAGAHVRGHNGKSIGICLIGGVDEQGHAEANYTFLQYKTLNKVIDEYLRRYPDAKVCGHYDMSPDLNGDGTIEASERIKECPCFNVSAYFHTA